MTNILTAAEGASVLRVLSTDPDMLALLPLVDRYIVNATGYNWAADSTIRSEAKAAARMLLVQWYENPGAQASGMVSPEVGLQAALTQLEAIALRIRRVRFEGRSGAGACVCEDALEGDIVKAVICIVGGSETAATSFETTISEEGQIQQTSGSDLSEKEYLAFLMDPADGVEYPA